MATYEANPYRPDLPSHLATADHDLFIFLRELIESLREQHNVTQAGDTTFPADMLDGFQKSPLFTLGSVGRFRHPTYGLIQARYVRFSDSSARIAPPLGFNTKHGAFAWWVTDEIADSSNQLAVGLGASSSHHIVDSYGWAIIAGVNLQPVRIRGGQPTIGASLLWNQSGELSLTGTAASVGRVVSLAGMTQPEPDLWVLHAGSVYIDPQTQATLGITDLPDGGGLSQEQLTELAETMLDLIICQGFNCGGSQSLGVNVPTMSPLFVDIKNQTIPASAQMIWTEGHTVPGVGAAKYKRSQTSGETLWRTRSMDGSWWELAEEIPNIDQFGARYDISTVDSYPAISTAIAYGVARGGTKLVATPGRVYYLSEMIEIDPTRITVDFGGATLDWSLKNFPNPDLQPNILANGDFAEGGYGWSQGSVSGAAVVYGAGFAEHIQPPLASPKAIFVDFGKGVVAPQGSILRVRVTIDFIDDVVDEATNTPFNYIAIMVVTGTGDLSFAGVIASKFVNNDDDDYAPGMTVELYAFLLNSNQANPRVRLQWQSSARVTNVEVKIFPQNFCVAITGRTDQFGHNHHELGNFRIRGRADQVNFVTGILSVSPNVTSSRANMYNVTIANGTVGRGIWIAHNSYLYSFYGCNIGGRNVGIQSLEGVFNSGENINFHGGLIGAGEAGIAIDNPGALQFNFHGVSFDFINRIFRGSGKFHGLGSHIEKHKSDFDYEIIADLTGNGTMIWDGGEIYGGQAIPGPYNTPFKGTSKTRVILRSVQLSGLEGQTWRWMEGGGQFISEGALGADSCPGIGQDSVQQNLIADGSIEATSGRFAMTTWIQSPAGAASPAREQLSRTKMTWNTGGTFNLTFGALSTLCTWSSNVGPGVQQGYKIVGDGIREGSYVADVPASNQFNLNQFGTGARTTTPCTYYNPDPLGFAEIARDVDASRTGAAGLRLTKSIDSQTNRGLNFYAAFPVTKGSLHALEFFYHVHPRALIGGESPTFNMFCQAYYYNLDQVDNLGLPTLGYREYAGMDLTQIIDKVTGERIVNGAPNGQYWNRIRFSTADIAGLKYPPDFATHMVIVIGLTAANHLTVIDFDDFAAFSF